MMPKVSVVIPVYGVEDYIERCARSLFEQSLDDMEFIFVNDCTNDRSMEVLARVLDGYPSRKDSTIIVNRTTNGKLAAARKCGQKLATGEFVAHCDSDDWVDSNLYERMYQSALLNHSDVVMCAIKDEFVNHYEERHYNNLPSDCKTLIENWYKDSVGLFVWNKLVRRSIYEDYAIESYDGINMWEDNGLMFRVFYYGSKLSYIDDSFYHYNRANVGAMTKGYGIESIRQMIKCASLLEHFVKEKPDSKRYEYSILALKLYARINLLTDDLSLLKEYHNLFPECREVIPFIKKDAFSQKGWIRFLFVKYHLEWLFVLLYKLGAKVRQ